MCCTLGPVCDEFGNDELPGITNTSDGISVKKILLQ